MRRVCVSGPVLPQIRDIFPNVRGAISRWRIRHGPDTAYRMWTFTGDGSIDPTEEERETNHCIAMQFSKA